MLSFLKKSQLVLGINSRNLKYIRPHNSRQAIKIADNKLLAKKVLRKAGLAVPQLYATIKNAQELSNFRWQDLPESFTLKPNRGLGGKGIVIVYGKQKRISNPLNPVWITADRAKISVAEMQSHILNILEGNYAITHLPDIAFFEERIKIIPLLKPYSFRGIPDIRIIVYNQVPVMAELRLPTEESGGRANLHLGGIGVGVDLGTGITTTAIQYNKLVEYVPKTRLVLSGIKIPFWREVLEMSVKAQLATHLGFTGVDIALDREKGPVILEINARPGLAIQIANLTPLQKRLERVAGLKIKTPQKGARLGRELFGGEVEEELEEISGRKIIGIYEAVKILDPQGKQYTTIAKVDTGAYRSAICQTLIDKLKLLGEPERLKTVRSALGKEERPIIPLSFILDNKLVQSEVFVADRTEMKYDIIIGRKDLKQFLIDPRKNLRLNQK